MILELTACNGTGSQFYGQFLLIIIIIIIVIIIIIIVIYIAHINY